MELERPDTYGRKGASVYCVYFSQLAVCSVFYLSICRPDTYGKINIPTKLHKKYIEIKKK